MQHAIHCLQSLAVYLHIANFMVILAILAHQTAQLPILSRSHAFQR